MEGTFGKFAPDSALYGYARNPYANQGSLAEAWQRGFDGKRAIAAPGSNYMRAYDEGQALRAAYALTQSQTPLRHPTLKGGVR